MAEPRALVRNASSPKQVRRAAEQDRFTAEAEAARLTALMSTYDNRWWMWDHLRTFGIYDAREAFSAEVYALQAKRSLGVQLLEKLLTICPDQYLLMQQENIDRDKKKIEPKARTEDPIEDDDDGN